MKNIALILILFLFVNFTPKKKFSYIKDYYQTVYKAEEAFYLKNYSTCYNLMSELEKKCKIMNQSRYYELEHYAISAAYLGEQKKALKLAKKLIATGYNIKYLKEEDSFQSIIKTKKWKKLENNYEKLHKKYLETINLELRKEIKTMTDFDQYYRKLLGYPNANKDSLWILIDSVDSSNNLRLQEIINTYGYPDYRIIGNSLIDNENVDPGIILFHVDDYEYYTKTLLKLIDKGQAPPSCLADFVDSYQRRVKEKQKWIYGIYEGEFPEYYIDYENLDKRRVSIGLPTMEMQQKLRDLRNQYYFPVEE